MRSSSGLVSSPIRPSRVTGPPRFSNRRSTYQGEEGLLLLRARYVSTRTPRGQGGAGDGTAAREGGRRRWPTLEKVVEEINGVAQVNLVGAIRIGRGLTQGRAPPLEEARQKEAWVRDVKGRVVVDIAPLECAA